MHLILSFPFRHPLLNSPVLTHNGKKEKKKQRCVYELQFGCREGLSQVPPLERTGWCHKSSDSPSSNCLLDFIQTPSCTSSHPWGALPGWQEEPGANSCLLLGKANSYHPAVTLGSPAALLGDKKHQGPMHGAPRSPGDVA